MGDKTCQFCRFAGLAESLDVGRLVCAQAVAATIIYKIVAAAETCDDFQPSDSATLPALEPGTRLIPLKCTPFAIVDAADYDELSRYEWWAIHNATTSYAVTRHQKRTLYMHRFITDAPKGMDVDHVDHNGLNNANKNLRVCTPKENAANRRPKAGCSSKYKGVSWHVHRRKFRARITYEGKVHYLGCFTDEKEAARAYDKKAHELFGRFAFLNFPNEITEPPQYKSKIVDRKTSIHLLSCLLNSDFWILPPVLPFEIRYYSVRHSAVPLSLVPFRGRGPPTNPDKLPTGASRRRS